MKDLIQNEQIKPADEKQIIKLLEKTDSKSATVKKLKQILTREMRKKKLYALNTERLSLTYTPPTYSKRFDSVRFKMDYPDLFKQYIKTVKVKDSVRIVILPEGDSD